MSLQELAVFFTIPWGTTKSESSHERREILATSCTQSLDSDPSTRPSYIVNVNMLFSNNSSAYTMSAYTWLALLSGFCHLQFSIAYSMLICKAWGI